jgi:hypothetical protein
MTRLGDGALPPRPPAGETHESDATVVPHPRRRRYRRRRHWRYLRRVRPTSPTTSTTTTVISLRSRANSMYVTADNAGASPLIANRTAIGTWEQFDLITD